MAPRIGADSWLQQDRFAAFREAYAYAANTTNAIPGLSRIDPEDAYYIWSSIQHGHERLHYDERGST